MHKILKESLLVLVVMVATSATFSVFASSEKVLSSADGKINAYHEKMNNLFNEKIEKLGEILDEENFFMNPDFKGPKDPNKCDENNVSTYCVSVEATKIYIDFINQMEATKNELPLDSGATTSMELLNAKAARDEKINIELESAKQVLDATLSAYNEYRLAYPLHKKYVTLINNLTKYRSGLESTTRQVSKFPGKFIDSTSTQCK